MYGLKITTAQIYSHSSLCHTLPFDSHNVRSLSWSSFNFCAWKTLNRDFILVFSHKNVSFSTLHYAHQPSRAQNGTEARHSPSQTVPFDCHSLCATSSDADVGCGTVQSLYVYEVRRIRPLSVHRCVTIYSDARKNILIFRFMSRVVTISSKRNWIRKNLLIKFKFSV